MGQRSSPMLPTSWAGSFEAISQVMKHLMAGKKNYVNANQPDSLIRA